MSTASLDKVVDEVVQEALAAVERMLDEAQSEANRIIDRAADEVSRELSSLKEAGEAAIAASRQRIISTAEIQAKNMAIAAVEEEISKTFDMVMGRLEKMASEDSFEYELKRLLDEAVELVGRDMIVSSNEKGLELLRKILSKSSYGVEVRLSEKPIKTVGGLEARSADGQIIFDNTLEARLERIKPQLRNELARMILRKD
ncbi:MAG: V-type ATP synthase subunit E [Candidatus Caldarchaeum sp.]|nr:V-type ATP synthase subunit E [Candidatus Caldarchaeum sp.]MDW8359772.1 V-type ATP synthase subunit E [Candidatus Caldarchaeum sp.]